MLQSNRKTALYCRLALEDAAEIVRDILKARLHGDSVCDIAKALKSKKIPTPTSIWLKRESADRGIKINAAIIFGTQVK